MSASLPAWRSVPARIGYIGSMGTLLITAGMVVFFLLSRRFQFLESYVVTGGFGILLAFLICGLLSVVTLVLSLFGNGRRLGLSILLSMLNIVIVLMLAGMSA